MGGTKSVHTGICLRHFCHNCSRDCIGGCVVYLGRPQKKEIIAWERCRMSENNIKRFYETIARIISEREQVRVTVQVREKGEAA